MAKEGSGYRMQAGGGLTTGAANTAFVLDMQRKLYRWSTADTGKVFADLFNLVCDRRTIAVAWLKLSQNKGSQTPGTDRMTRHKVEKRAGGVAAFLEEIGENCVTGPINPNPSGNGLSRSRANRGISGRWVSPRSKTEWCK